MSINLRYCFSIIRVLATSLGLLMSVAAWSAASTNYQLDYSAFDGGGGLASSSAYNLAASAVGTSLQGGVSSSSSYATVTGTGLIDDDGDGLDNGVEQIIFNTNPSNSDTDNDLLSDGEEVITYLTDPTLFDTDGDTLGDGEEIAGGWNPLDALDPFGIIENVPLPAWAILILGLVILSIRQRSRA